MTGTAPVRVLVVDDEKITADAHAHFLRRVGGFEVAGIAYDGRECLRILREQGEETPIDLILLDMTLPDVHGLDLCRTVRASGMEVDVIAITAVRDVTVVRASVSLGIVQYLIKPFTYATFAERLRNYLAFRAGLDDTAGVATQRDVDQSLARLRTLAEQPLQKGLSEETLATVTDAVRSADAAVSAGQVADATATSRVTARRYLEHLVEAGSVVRTPRYGTPGRPEFEYRWR